MSQREKLEKKTDLQHSMYESAILLHQIFHDFPIYIYCNYKCIGAEKFRRQIFHGKVLQRQNLSATEHLRSKMSGRQNVDTNKSEVRAKNAVSHTAKKILLKKTSFGDKSFYNQCVSITK